MSDLKVGDVIDDPASAPPAPQGNGMDLGVTEPVPAGPVTQPLRIVRPGDAGGLKPGDVIDDPGQAPAPAVLPEVQAFRSHVAEQAAVADMAATPGVPGDFAPPTPDIDVAQGKAQVALGGDVERCASYLRWLGEHSELTQEDGAEILKIASVTGRPVDSIRENLPAFKKQLANEGVDYDALVRDHPVLADFMLEDPARFHVIKDRAADFTHLDAVLGKWSPVTAQQAAAEEDSDPQEKARLATMAQLDPNAVVRDWTRPVWMDWSQRIWTKDFLHQLTQTQAALQAGRSPDLVKAEDQTLDQRQAAWSGAGFGRGVETRGMSPRDFYATFSDKRALLNPDERRWMADVDAAGVRSQIATADAYPLVSDPAKRDELVRTLAEVEKGTHAGVRAATLQMVKDLDSQVSTNRNYGEFTRTTAGKIVYGPLKMQRVLVGNAAAGLVGNIPGLIAYNFMDQFGPLAFDLQQTTGADGKKIAPGKALGLAAGAAGFSSIVQAIPLGRISGRLLSPAGAAFVRAQTAEAATRLLVQPGAKAVLAHALATSGTDYAAGLAAMAAGQMGVSAARERAKMDVDPKHEFDGSQVLQDGLDALKAGAPDLLLVSAAGAGREALTDLGRAKKAQASAVALRELHESGGKVGDLLKAAPAEGKALLAAMAKQPGTEVGETLSQNVEGWQRYWQKQKVDPRQIASELGPEALKSYDAAVTEKGDRFEIPTHEFIVKLANGDLAKHGQALLPDMATSHDTMTLREHVAEAQRRADRTKELAKVEPDAMEADQRQVFDAFKQQALDAGESETSAKANAQLAAAFYRTQAERFGGKATAWDLYQQHQITVEGPGSEAARLKRHAAQALEDYNEHPAGRALEFLKAGQGEGDLGTIAADLRERRLAAGEAPVAPEVSRKIADVQGQIAKIEAQGAREGASALERPSSTQKVRVAISPDPEGGTRFDLHAGGEAPAGGDVREVSLPGWLKPEEFTGDRHAWEWTWSALEQGPAAPEHVQKAVHEFMRRGLEGFPPDEFALKQGYALARLAAGKGGKRFAGLRERLKAWAEEPEATRGPPPIPDRAWGGLIDTTRMDVEGHTSSRGYENKTKREAMDKWLTQTKAELDPERPTYRERPPSWYTKPGEMPEPEAPKSADRLTALRQELADLNASAAAAGRQAPIRPKLDWEAATRILGKDAEKLPTVEGGILPDDLARAVGAGSGDKLLRDMVERQDRAGWVRDEAQRRAAAGEEARPVAVPEASRVLTDRLHRMKPEDRAEELYRDRNTGLLHARAFDDLPPDPKRPMVGHISVEGTKWLQDHPDTGHAAGDLLYRMAGKALHDAAPDANPAKVGGDFAVRVKDQAELDGIVARMNERMPVKGFTATGKAAESLQAAGGAHAAWKAGEEQATPPRRAERGQRPLGVEAQAPTEVKLPAERAAPEIPQALRQKAGAMTTREAFRRMYVEKGTGALTGEGYHALPAKAHRASLDLNGLKHLNLRLGTRGGDVVLALFGRLAQEHGGSDFDFAHLHGDEYAAQSNDRASLDRFIAKIERVSDDVRAVVRGEDGKLREVQGLSFGRGIGGSDAEAERGLAQHKIDLSDAGKRGAAADARRLRDVEGAGAGEPVLSGPDDLARGRPGEPGGGRAQGYAGAPERLPEGVTRLEQPSRAVGSREFKAWFKDSKVVDEQGAPVVAYHGSATAGAVESFDPKTQNQAALYGPGFYFTEDPTVASEYVEKGASDAPAGSAAGVLPVHLSIKNPFRVDSSAADLLPKLLAFKAKRPPPEMLRLFEAARREDPGITNPDGFGSWADNTEWAYKILDKKGMNGEEAARPYFDWFIQQAMKDLAGQVRDGSVPKGAEFGEEAIRFIERNVFEVAQEGSGNIQDVLKRLGFDGITHIGGGRVGGGERMHRVWIAFDPGQAKSVFNRGTFDPKDPRILYQPGRDRPGARLTAGEDARGAIEFKTPGPGEPVKLEIRLFNSDKSTLAHELAHGFGIVLGQLATHEGAPEEVKADYQRMLDAMGYKDHAERLEQPDAAKEEKLSHLFEMYLAEGKAPSEALKPAFRRFRGWMKSLYKGLLGISDQYEQVHGKPLELSDDVRRIFDRMLATDEAVDRARTEAEPSPPADTEAMSPQELAEYQRLDQDDREVSKESLVRKAAEDDARESNAAARAEGEKIKGRVERDVVAKDPGYRALVYLQKGTIPGAERAAEMIGAEGEPAKLDRKALVREIGAEAVAALPRGVFARKGGLEADEMAARLGFEKGSDLLDAIRGKDFDGAVRDEVRARVEEKYGTALVDDPARLEGAAKEAVQTEAGAKKLFLRLQSMARQVDPSLGRQLQGMSVEAIHDQARTALADKALRAISPDRYANMERAANQRATDAWAAGKKDAAWKEVESALWAHVYSRAAAEVRDEVEQAESRIRGAGRDTWRAALGKASPDYLAGHDAIMGALGLAAVRPDAPPSAEAVQSMLLRLVSDAVGTLDEGKVQVPGIDVEGLQDLARNPRRWSDLTPTEALNAADAIRLIRHVANAANEITIDGKRADREATIDQMISSLQQNTKALPKINDDPMLTGKMDPLRRVWQNVDAIEMDRATIAHKMDGGDRDGVFHKILLDNELAARDRRNELTRTVLKDLTDKFEKSGMDRARLTEVLDVGKELPLDPRLAELRDGTQRTRSNLLMMALNLGNESNAERFLGGYKWTREQVMGVLGKHLNANEWRWVQGVWDTLESLYPDMAKLHQEQYGLAPEKIKAKAFSVQTAEGETVDLQGGYFPARYDPRVGSERKTGEKQVAADVASFFQQNYTRAPSVAAPHAKARAAHYEDLVNLNWGIVPAHVSQVIQDITYRQYVRETAALLLNDRLHNALVQHIGEPQTRQLRAWLRAVANARADSLPDHLGFMEGLGGMGKSAAAKLALGFSVPRTISDIVSDPAIAVGAGYVRPDYMAKASAKVIAPAAWKAARAFALENSPELRGRSENVRHKMNEALGQMGGRKVMQNPTLRAVRDSAFITMELGDHLITTPMWHARYDQSMAEHQANGFTPEEAHQRSVRDADDMIRKVMPPVDLADKPSIIRDHAALGALLLFHGHANKIGAILRRRGNDMVRAFQMDGTLGEKASSTAKFIGTISAIAIANGVLAEYFAGRGKTKDETTEQWVERKTISAVFYPVPIVNGPLESLVSGWVTGERKPVSLRAAPGYDYVFRVLRDIGAGVGKWMDGDGDAGLAATQAVEVLGGLAAGTLSPPRQIHDTAEYIHKLASGETTARGPGDVLGGLIFGEDEQQSANPLTDLQDLASGNER